MPWWLLLFVGREAVQGVGECEGASGGRIQRAGAYFQLILNDFAFLSLNCIFKVCIVFLRNRLLSRSFSLSSDLLGISLVRIDNATRFSFTFIDVL